jgi:hypothetical protein
MKHERIVTAGWCAKHRYGDTSAHRRARKRCPGCYGPWRKADGILRGHSWNRDDFLTRRCLQCGKPAVEWGGHVHRKVRVSPTGGADL